MLERVRENGCKYCLHRAANISRGVFNITQRSDKVKKNDSRPTERERERVRERERDRGMVE
jgi:hypothetical protein